ncbi:Aminotransferase domain containing protein [Aphelenchoides bicaudatus]|nr:Aminotransferase domain containing protein [Aphelenchoides bicaudatus]
MPPNDKIQFKSYLNSEDEERIWAFPQKKVSKVPYTRSEYRQNVCEEGPLFTRLGVQFCHTILIVMGFIAEFLRHYRLIGSKRAQEREEQKDFPPLGNHFESMYSNEIYRMGADVLSRPLCGVPDTNIVIQNRDFSKEWVLEPIEGKTKAMNFGSYNYLGFSQIVGPCADAVCKEIDRRGLHNCSTDYESEYFQPQRELEKKVSRFLGTEEALCFPNGFGINTVVLPNLADKNTLVMSDQLNHSSLLVGMRASGAKIVIFNHNGTFNLINLTHAIFVEMNDLEAKLRQALCADFSSKTPTIKKILIVVEGIYSMEGTILNLPRLLEVKQKYNAYLFIDEAHSIGALGGTGRGITDYWGCDPQQIDVLMGTFTKSFGAAGGYIAGRKHIIDFLRQKSPSRFYASALAPPLISQAIASMEIMMGEEMGRERNEKLIENVRYFRQKLSKLGFLVYGHEDTAIISVLTFYMTKSVCFGREALKRGVAVCCVGFPATPLNKSRVRFCISSQHTKEQMDEAIRIADICGDIVGCKYKKSH